MLLVFLGRLYVAMIRCPRNLATLTPELDRRGCLLRYQLRLGCSHWTGLLVCLRDNRNDGFTTFHRYLPPLGPW